MSIAPGRNSAWSNPRWRAVIKAKYGSLTGTTHINCFSRDRHQFILSVRLVVVLMPTPATEAEATTEAKERFRAWRNDRSERTFSCLRNDESERTFSCLAKRKKRKNVLVFAKQQK